MQILRLFNTPGIAKSYLCMSLAEIFDIKETSSVEREISGSVRPAKRRLKGLDTYVTILSCGLSLF
jgi:hypothetical protein